MQDFLHVKTMNCLCNIFDNEVVWLIIIALILLSVFCNGYNPCGGHSGGYGGGCGC